MICINKYFFINNLKNYLKNNLKCRKLNHNRKLIINFQKGIYEMDEGKKGWKFSFKKVKGFCQLKTVKHIGLLVALLALKVTARFKVINFEDCKNKRNFILSN